MRILLVEDNATRVVLKVQGGKLEVVPRKEVVHQPADGAGCTCPDCGGVMSRLGEDVTEVLDYVPGHFRVIRHVRPKLRRGTRAPALVPVGLETGQLSNWLTLGLRRRRLPCLRSQRRLPTMIEADPSEFRYASRSGATSR